MGEIWAANQESWAKTEREKLMSWGRIELLRPTLCFIGELEVRPTELTRF